MNYIYVGMLFSICDLTKLDCRIFLRLYSKYSMPPHRFGFEAELPPLLSPFLVGDFRKFGLDLEAELRVLVF